MAGEKVGSVYFIVEAETAKLINDIDNASKALDKLKSSFGKMDGAADQTSFKMTQTAAAVQQLGRQAQAAQNPLSGLNRLLGGLLTMRGIQSISAMADAYTDLQNRLRLVTNGQQQLADATDDVFRIANATSQSVDSIGQVYQRFAQNAKGLGLDLKQVAAVTETVAKAVAISGASSASAQAALTQFGQALASGTLRGEELNSVMEQTPGLAAAIAKGLGVTIGELRSIAAEGQITSQKLIAALSKAAEDVDKQFATRVKTVSQAVTELQNSMMRFVGEASTVSGASANIANAISLVSQNLEALSSILLAVGAGALARYIAQMGAKTLATMRDFAATRQQAAAEIGLARAQVATAQAALAETGAMAANAQTKALVTARTDALAAAELRLAAASRAAGTIMGTLAGVLGGPAGIIGLVASVAAGMYLMSGGVDKAKVDLAGFEVSVESARKKLEAMAASQREIAKDMLKSNAAQAVKDLDSALENLSRGTMVAGGQTQWAWINYAGAEMKELTRQVKNGEITANEFDSRVTALVAQFGNANNASDKWRNSMLELVGVARNATIEVGNTTGALDNFKAAANGASDAIGSLSDKMAGWNGKPGEMLQKLVNELFTIEEAGNRVKQTQREIAQQRMAGIEVGADMEKRLLDAAQKVDAATKARDAARKNGGRHAGREESAMAYYYGLVAANETALAKIDAEEKKALEENAKRRAVDKKNAEVYENARVEIVKKYAREREKFEEQNTQEIAAFNIQMMVDQEEKIAAIRDEAIRRADASVRLGAASVEQAERAKALAVETYSRESAKLQEQVMQAASDNKIVATQSEAEKIILIYAEAVRRADAQYRAGAISFAMSEQSKVKAATDAANALRNLQAQYDPLANEQQRFAQQMDGLKRLNEAKLLEDQRYRDLTAGAERTHQQQMLALHEQVFAAQSMGNQLLISSLNQVQQVGASAFTGILTGAMSGAEAMRSLGNAILSEVVGSIVRVGVEYVKSLIVGKAMGAAASAASVAEAGAVGAAWAPAAAFASLATLGANAVPAGAAIAATVGLAEGLSFVGFAGGGYTGPGGKYEPAGIVHKGEVVWSKDDVARAGGVDVVEQMRKSGRAPEKMYRLSRSGVPEVLNMAGGKQYMLPNARGEVVSNRDATAGNSGGGLSLTVNLFGAPEGTSVEQKQVGDSEFVLNVMMNDLSREGPYTSMRHNLEGTRRVGR